MPLRILTWLISLGFHAGFALAMLLPAGGAALHTGTGEDTMVVEQGIAIEGFAKMGEDQVTLEEVEATPVMAAVSQPLPEEVKPIDELAVISSDTGPEQENVQSTELEEVKEPEPDKEELKEPEEEVVEQPLPPQIAAVQQESVVAMRESSGEELKGGDVTAHSAYVGALRTHLERNKVNPRTNLIGTAVVRFKVNAAGELLERRIVTSSGKKALDDAALASIEKSAPFPKMPEGLSDMIELSVPFRFTVR
jgi:protein TonB